MAPEQLREWMVRMGLDKNGTAQALGITVRSLERYLSGDRRISKTVAKLCVCLESRRDQP